MDDKVLLDMDIEVPGAKKEEEPRLRMAMKCGSGVTVLFGPSGAGKSTCLLSIAGLVKPARGWVKLGGEYLYDSAGGVDIRTEKRRVALVFQTLALFPHYSAIENVMYGLPRAMRGQERRTQAMGWLERMQVPHVAERRPGTLSGGEAQRVALARALSQEPGILLLDEPFSAVDTPLRRKLGQDVKALVDELGLAAVLVTHDREDARALGTKMVMLERGRVVGEGKPDELLRAADA